tara:strand:+ start:15 stop:200 length:186 start_codon:yes stop_codon:yes gene_type:complete
MKYISNSNTEMLTEMMLTGKTRAEIKKEDRKRANESKVLLSDDKPCELARKWGATFTSGTK